MIISQCPGTGIKIKHEETKEARKDQEKFRALLSFVDDFPRRN
jgi:hypothetical protein